MSKLLLFAGTTEGRRVAGFLKRCEIPAVVCTATEYGKCRIDPADTLEIRSERLNAEEMTELIRREDISLVVDATHPYAVLVSENIRHACALTATEYLRLLRPSEETGEDCTVVASVEEAAEWLKNTEGRVLVTTGSKELSAFTAVPDYQKRIFARVLPTPAVVEHCAELGFDAGHLIAMQGPFSLEMNRAMLRQTGARILVTKESGKNGGFEEKVQAVREADAHLLVIGRPSREEGKTESEVCRIIAERYGKTTDQEVIIAGIGMGAAENMTLEVQKAIREADVLIGAGRMLEAAKEVCEEAGRKPCLDAYQPDEIREFLNQHPEYGTAVLLQSGDIGFFSGAKRLLDVLAGRKIRVLSGISSVVYLCGRLQIPWENVCLLSLHGRKANGVDAVRHHARTFLLSGKKGGAAEFCRELCIYGLGHVVVTVGENLSYPDERMVTGTAEELKDQDFATLCVIFAQNSSPVPREPYGLPDENFVRGKVPMTKREVRAVSLSYLGLHEDSVAWDVGAGTGSVSVEMALQAWKGEVFAVERNEEGVGLIRANAEKNGCANLTAVFGSAPEVLRKLPTPTHVFVGGSGGKLQEILQTALEKNPAVRVVVNAVSLETIAEAVRVFREMPFEDPETVCLRADRSRLLGKSHLMMGMNPIYIFAATGGGNDESEQSS